LRDEDRLRSETDVAAASQAGFRKGVGLALSRVLFGSNPAVSRSARRVGSRRNLAIGGHIGLWRRCNIRDAGIQPNPARRTELVLTRPWSRLMSIAQT
jgi:hypothetical protein